MKSYKFKQCYLYGDDWDGEITNIPDSAVFYNISTATLQEWYIVAPLNDFTKNEHGDISIKGYGLAQVLTYTFADFGIIHLNKIIPVDNWPDVGKDSFEKTFNPIFSKYFIIEYSKAQYEMIEDADSITFNKVSDKEIISISRIKSISCGRKFNCTTIIVKDWITKTNNYGIYPAEISMNIIDDITNRKFVLSTDHELYKNLFKEASDWLF